jgi:hypothetical protein
MGKFGKNRIPKFMMGEPIPESHEGKSMRPTILSLSDHGDDHAMIIIKTNDGQEVELRFDYDGDGMLTATHNDHEYSIPVEVEVVSDSDNDNHVDEISGALKHRAFMKAQDVEMSLDPNREVYRRNKATAQAKLFSSHVNPEIHRDAQSIAKMLGDDVRVEIKKGGISPNNEYVQVITIIFYRGDTKIDGVVIYSTGQVDMVTGKFPDNVQRRLVRFVDKVKELELVKPEAGQMSEKLNKGQKPLGKNRNGKPDFLDVDKDGDKKEPMKKAFQDKEMGKAAKTFESFVNECWSPMEEGYSSAMSEEAKQAIKTLCEDLLIKEAQMCDEDADPNHTYESYLNECGSYMTERMMESSANLNVNESTAYSCDTCGERAEHEEIEKNPRMRCSNCGDSNWIPEY